MRIDELTQADQNYIDKFDPNKRFRFRFQEYSGMGVGSAFGLSGIFEWNPSEQTFKSLDVDGNYKSTILPHTKEEQVLFKKLGWRDTGESQGAYPNPRKYAVQPVTFQKVLYKFYPEEGSWRPDVKAKDEEGKMKTTPGSPVKQGTRLEHKLFKLAGYKVQGYKSLFNTGRFYKQPKDLVPIGKRKKQVDRERKHDREIQKLTSKFLNKEITKSQYDDAKAKLKVKHLQGPFLQRQLDKINPEKGDFFNQRGIKKYPIFFPINLPRRIFVGVGTVVGKTIDKTLGGVINLVSKATKGRGTSQQGRISQVDFNPPKQSNTDGSEAE